MDRIVCAATMYVVVDALSTRLMLAALWDIVESLPPRFRARPQGGGQAALDDRTVFTALVYVPTSGCTWRHLPPSFGVSAPTAHRRIDQGRGVRRAAPPGPPPTRGRWGPGLVRSADSRCWDPAIRDCCRRFRADPLRRCSVVTCRIRSMRFSWSRYVLANVGWPARAAGFSPRCLLRTSRKRPVPMCRSALSRTRS